MELDVEAYIGGGFFYFKRGRLEKEQIEKTNNFTVTFHRKTTLVIATSSQPFALVQVIWERMLNRR